MANVLDFNALKHTKLDDQARDSLRALLDLCTQHAQAQVHVDLLAGMIEEVRVELVDYLEKTGQLQEGDG